MSHTSKHRFISNGGQDSGNKHYSETPLAYYALLFTGAVDPATQTDKQNCKRYALQLSDIIFNYVPHVLYLQYASSRSFLIGSANKYYIKLGKIIIGKVIISLWSIYGRLIIGYDIYRKMNLREYKSYNNLKHDYHSYHGMTNYQNLKDINRRLNKYRKTT